MNNEKSTLSKVLIAVSTIFNLAVSTTAIYYGVTNLKELCSDSFIHLAIWLLVQGGVLLFITIGALPLACLLGPTGETIYWIVSVFYNLFNLAWSVVGGVILWRDSSTCKDLDPAFYLASMTVVIIGLVTAFLAWCCLIKHNKERQADSSHA